MNDSMMGGDTQDPVAAGPSLPPAPPVDDTPDAPSAADKAKNKKIATRLFARIAKSKAEILEFVPTWQSNVEQRMGRPTLSQTPGVQTDTDIRSEINPDWSLTKTKTANLYSQVPTVQGTHENKQYAAAVPPFMKSVNYELSEKRTNVGVAMQECLNDVVNASGIAGLMVGYAARFIDKEVPSVDTKMIPPDVLQQLMAAGKIPMTTSPQVTDQRMFITRISPKDLLKPVEFAGSNFDDGAWIGYRGRKPWAEAKSEWKLTDEDKASVINGAPQNVNEQLKIATGAQSDQAQDDSVEFEEVYYWRYRVDPEEPSFCAIWKLVRVVGKDEAVVHEAWRGQKVTPDGKYVGSKKFPIRILTLTYITDNAIPPSDTEAGKVHVQDLRMSRAQMFANRKHSLPMRWYDVNRLDPVVGEQLMRGTFQGIVPVNGDGARSLGELARASYPSEDLTFDRNTHSDLQEVWQLGPNQMGSVAGGSTTKGESSIVQQNFATRIGQERAQVGSFFLGAVEVLAGWMALYSDFPILTDQERQAMEQAWDHKTILHDLVLKIRPDSTIVLDVSQQLERIFKFINMTAKSGFVNVKPLIIQAAELSGIDPTEVVVDPPPPKPDDPNISYRFTGKDDLMNPMVVAMLLKSGELPNADQIKQAIDLLKLVNQLAQAPTPVPSPPGPDGVPPPTPDGPAGPPQPPTPPVMPHPSAPDAHPDWHIAPTIAKRQRDI